MASIEQDFNKAVEKFRAGEIKLAGNILLKINKRQVGIPDLLHDLANIAMEAGKTHLSRSPTRLG